MPSKKYLLLHRSPIDQQPPTPAQMQEMFVAWSDWKEKFKENILDMGGKLGRTGKVVKGSVAMDGPFVEAKEIVGGYMIVSAESYDRAVEVAKGVLAMSPEARIEIREIVSP